MFTPLGLRFFCNELVRTTCGKSTKLKVRQSLGFKEDIDGLRLEKKEPTI